MKNKVVRIILTLFLFNLTIFIHEAGHFVAMNQYGVEVDTFSVGMNLPFIPTYEKKISAYPNTRFIFSPVFLGGYVEASRDGEIAQKALPVVAQAHIFAAGIEMNLYTAMIFLLLSYAFDGRGKSVKPIKISLMIGAVICLALFAYAPFIEIIVFPTIGLALVAFILITKARTFEGPIRLFQSFANSSQSFKGLILSFAVLNVDFFTLNAIPLLPADGGHIIEMLLARVSERASHFFIAISLSIMLAGVLSLIAIRLIQKIEQRD